jgi:SAM-dependent methyltransferase
MINPECPICQSSTVFIGTKRGAMRREDFHLVRCQGCSLAFISNPWTEYAEIYSQDYYCGKGADPLIDYQFELDCPQSTIRVFEWAGLLRVVASMLAIGQTTTWLDYGCGNGGLVRYLNQNSACKAVGFEEGWIADRARQKGIPILTSAEIAAQNACYDVITLIEVLEHVTDPVAVLKEVRRLLRPGGVLFLTTGNAEPHRNALLQWSYLTPEIHISLFEPRTIAIAMERAGLVPKAGGWRPGWGQIFLFKILKNLGIKRRHFWQEILPFGWLGRLLDTRFRLTAHPFGVCPPDKLEAQSS